MLPMIDQRALAQAGVNPTGSGRPYPAQPAMPAAPAPGMGQMPAYPTPVQKPMPEIPPMAPMEQTTAEGGDKKGGGFMGKWGPLIAALAGGGLLGGLGAFGKGGMGGAGMGALAMGPIGMLLAQMQQKKREQPNPAAVQNPQAAAPVTQ